MLPFMVPKLHRVQQIKDALYHLAACNNYTVVVSVFALFDAGNISTCMFTQLTNSKLFRHFQVLKVFFPSYNKDISVQVYIPVSSEIGMKSEMDSLCLRMIHQILFHVCKDVAVMQITATVCPYLYSIYPQ